MSVVQVIATRQGYDNVKVREEGEVFTVSQAVFDARSPDCWFEEAVAAPVAAPQFVPKSQLQGDLGSLNDAVAKGDSVAAARAANKVATDLV